MGNPPAVGAAAPRAPASAGQTLTLRLRRDAGSRPSHPAVILSAKPQSPLGSALDAVAAAACDPAALMS